MTATVVVVLHTYMQHTHTCTQVERDVFDKLFEEAPEKLEAVKRVRRYNVREKLEAVKRVRRYIVCKRETRGSEEGE